VIASVNSRNFEKSRGRGLERRKKGGEGLAKEETQFTDNCRTQYLLAAPLTAAAVGSAPCFFQQSQAKPKHHIFNHQIHQIHQIKPQHAELFSVFSYVSIQKKSKSTRTPPHPMSAPRPRLSSHQHPRTQTYNESKAFSATNNFAAKTPRSPIFLS
jgi:hypothetical protein